MQPLGDIATINLIGLIAVLSFVAIRWFLERRAKEILVVIYSSAAFSAVLIFLIIAYFLNGYIVHPILGILCLIALNFVNTLTYIKWKKSSSQEDN